MESRADQEYQIFSQLKEIQKMYQAARSEHIKERSQNVQDESNHVNELYENVLATLKKSSWAVAALKADSSQQKLIYAIVKHFMGCCYHFLKQHATAIEVLNESAQNFSGLSLDLVSKSFYAETLLLLGENESSLGSSVKPEYFEAAKKSLDQAVKLWCALAEEKVVGASRRLMLAQLYLGRVLTWNGKNKDDADCAVQSLQAAYNFFQIENKAVTPQQKELDLMEINHFLGVNFLRLTQYNEVRKCLNALHQSAELCENKNLQMDAKLGLALCDGLENENGFSLSAVKSSLAQAYEFYFYNKKHNTYLLSHCIAGVKTWLSGLNLPDEKDRPQQLQWLVSMAQNEECLVEEDVLKMNSLTLA